MGAREFRWRLAGLSDTSRFRGALSDQSRRVDDHAEAQALLSM